MAAQKRDNHEAPTPVSAAVLQGKRQSSPPAKRSGAAIFFAAAVVFVLATQWIDGSNRQRVIEKATRMDLAAGQDITARLTGSFRGDDQILPASGIDGKWWVLHTEKMLRDGTWRVRHTGIDNSPEGREMHWSSPLIWLLAVLAKLIAAFSSGRAVDHVATAAIFAGPILLFAALSAFAFLVVRRYGWAAAAFGILVIGTSSPILQFFRLGDCDHHGIVSTFAMLGVLCLAAGGGGYQAARGRKDAGARAWFIGGGVASAAALWVSAATEIPVLAGTVLGVIVAAFLNRRCADLRPAAHWWSLWGLAGGTAALTFYAVEYFPGHMGWRLEVNHPLYALAWMGGGHLLARTIAAIHGAPFARFTASDLGKVAVSLLLLAAPGAAILLFPGGVFWVSDRFLLELHNRHIMEFQPLWTILADGDWLISLFETLGWPLLAGGTLIGLFFSGRIPPLWRAPLVLTSAPALVMLGLACKQVRWLGVAVMLWAGVSTLLFALCSGKLLIRPIPRLATWCLAVACALFFALNPLLASLSWLASRDRPDSLPKNILPNVVTRDIVRRIMAAEPGRRPVILCSPTTSTELAYYGDVGVIGTLYWENMPGLKAAAEIFSAPDEEAARKSILRRGITHILLFSWDNFASDYQKLYAGSGGAAAPSNPFIPGLLEGKDPPDWLRPLFYPVPAEFGLGGATVWLYEVVDGQTSFDALLQRGIFASDAGDFRAARGIFLRAGEKQPGDPRIPQLLRYCAEHESAPASNDTQKKSTKP